MRRAIIGVVAAALSASTFAAVPAQAASSGSGGSISHPDIALYAGQHNKTTRISYAVKNPTLAQIERCFDDKSYPEYGEEYVGWGEFDWSLDVETFDRRGNLVDTGPYAYSGRDAKSGRMHSSRWYDWEKFGLYSARATISRSFSVYGLDEDGWTWEHYCTLPDVRYSDSFSFKQASHLKVNATPEPARRGKVITVKGSLKYWNPLANYGDGAKRALKGKTVRIYFDPAGSKGPVYKGSTKVSVTGNWSKSLKQKKSGSWIATYSGSSTLTPDRARDAVMVRGR